MVTKRGREWLALMVALMLNTRTVKSTRYFNVLEESTNILKLNFVLLQLSLQWLQELHKNVTFFETLMDVTDAVVNSRRFVDVPIRFSESFYH